MPQRALLQIAFRLVGVYYFARALEFTPSGFGMLIEGISDFQLKHIAFPLVGFAWHYCIAIWLLKGAPHLLRRITPEPVAAA